MRAIPQTRGRHPFIHRSQRWHLVTLGVLFAIALTVQSAVGAYTAERGTYSDEAAHFLNGLLIRDYLTHGLGESPLHYAREYYYNYPKIAPGMWPPLFHVVLGLLLLPGWPPQATALALVAFATAWAAWRLMRILLHATTPLVAAAVAATFVLTPAIINLTSVVMLDIVVAAFAIEAAYWLSFFSQTKSWRHGAMFGLAAAGGCLTKGNGLSILLMPLLMILFTRQFDLLRRSGLYLAAAILLVVAGPIVVLSMYLDATIGDFRATTWADVFWRASYYSNYLRHELGIPLLILAAIGTTGALLWRQDDDGPSDSLPFRLGLASLLFAGVLFHLLNPHWAISGRYVTLIVAPLLGLVPSGLATVMALVRRPNWIGAARGVLVAGLLAFGVVTTAAWTPRPALGFREIVDLLDAQHALAGHRMLVVSEERGEGAFVAEVAARQPLPAASVIRASKLIASDDWAGHNFHLRFASAGALMQELEDLHVDYLVIDESLGRDHALWPPTEDLLTTEEDRLEHITTVSGGRRVSLYRLKYRSAGTAKALEMSISSPLGKLITP